ncbi:MAG: acyloxyacyl hydrolase [Crocinitomicaceae bacterium]|nr:acyloxyacyl hydrolase [Crocinitomicaceae bacterium]
MRLTGLYIIFLFLANSGSLVHSQVVKPDEITYSFKGGIFFAHRPSMNHLVKRNAWSHEISLVRNLADPEMNQIFNQPKRGLTFEARNFGNNEVLGHAFSISCFNQMNLFSNQKGFMLNMRIATGLGYITKTYDEFENPKNNAIGSHLNAKVALSFTARKYFNSKYYMDFGAEFNHFSNGSLTTPNLGLNSPSLILGIGYNFDEKNTDPYRNAGNFIYPDTNSKVKHEFYATMIGSIKEIGEVPYEAQRYRVGAIKLGYGIQPFHKWSFEGGIDIIYNEANLYKYRDSTFTSSDVPQVGVFLGFGFHFNKSVLAVNYGYYLLDKINPEGRLYNRIGYRYYFFDHWYGAFAIKANFARADYFELGIGYSIQR